MTGSCPVCGFFNDCSPLTHSVYECKKCGLGMLANKYAIRYGWNSDEYLQERHMVFLAFERRAVNELCRGVLDKDLSASK